MAPLPEISAAGFCTQEMLRWPLHGLPIRFARKEPFGGSYFNGGLLCCLPKASAGEDEAEGTFYEPSGTRPLTIVNTDNRIIASAYRLRWEPILEPWVSPQQQGFLRGRSLLSNVVAIEEASMEYSLSSLHPGVILFDLAAAFPSVLHPWPTLQSDRYWLPSRSL